jgi:intracellular sulfur oxidation DsrE/DsrF family protein
MKTIANFLRPDEAQLLRLKLHSCGILSFVQDENATQLNPWRMWATGGVRVQVADEDLQAAQIFLERERYSETQLKAQPVNGGIECLSCGVEMPSGQTRCPACGWSYEDRV